MRTDDFFATLERQLESGTTVPGTFVARGVFVFAAAVVAAVVVFLVAHDGATTGRHETPAVPPAAGVTSHGVATVRGMLPLANCPRVTPARTAAPAAVMDALGDIARGDHSALPRGTHVPVGSFAAKQVRSLPMARLAASGDVRLGTCQGGDPKVSGPGACIVTPPSTRSVGCVTLAELRAGRAVLARDSDDRFLRLLVLFTPPEVTGGSFTIAGKDYPAQAYNGILVSDARARDGQRIHFTTTTARTRGVVIVGDSRYKAQAAAARDRLEAAGLPVLRVLTPGPGYEVHHDGTRTTSPQNPFTFISQRQRSDDDTAAAVLAALGLPADDQYAGLATQGDGQTLGKGRVLVRLGSDVKLP